MALSLIALVAKLAWNGTNAMTETPSKANFLVAKCVTLLDVKNMFLGMLPPL